MIDDDGATTTNTTTATIADTEPTADVSEDADLCWTGGDPDAEDTVTHNVYFGSCTLSVTVTDDTEIDTVIIDSSPIGGSDDAQMTNINGTDTWTITTNAEEAINLGHDLIVTATDTSMEMRLIQGCSSKMTKLPFYTTK